MPLYAVKPDRNIEHEGIPYQAGDQVKLPSEIAVHHGDNLKILFSDEELEELEDIALDPNNGDA